MATNFPTSVDSLVNPVSNDSLNSPSHSAQHANANDAIEAIETYLLNGQGLMLVKKQTIGSGVASVNVTGAFSAAYENYKILVSGGVGSTAGDLQFKLGTGLTAYYNTIIYSVYSSGSVLAIGNSNASQFTFAGYANTSTIDANIDLNGPFLTKNTTFRTTSVQTATGGAPLFNGGYQGNATSFTDFTLSFATGTLTGGTIYVYGYGIGQ